MRLSPIKSLRSDKRGVGFAFIVVLISIFVCSMLWMVFTEPLTTIKEFGENQVGGEEKAKTTYDLLYMAWRYWPLVLVFGLGILYGILAAIRRAPYTGIEYE